MSTLLFGWPTGSVSASHQCGPGLILGWGSDSGAVSEKGLSSRVWATLRPWVGRLSRWPSLNLALFESNIIITRAGRHRVIKWFAAWWHVLCCLTHCLMADSIVGLVFVPCKRIRNPANFCCWKSRDRNPLWYGIRNPKGCNPESKEMLGSGIQDLRGFSYIGRI